MNDEVDQNDRIQLPPGWGPVLFLAAVVILSDLALGLRVRSMIVNRSVATAPMASGRGGTPGAMPNVPLAGQAAPTSLGGPGAATPTGSATETYTVDESVFTDELDDYVRSVAEASGMDPDEVPSARQVYEQMKRSGLLPVNGDLDIQTVLGGHVREMAKHLGGAAPQGGPGMPGGGAGMPGQPGPMPGAAPGADALSQPGQAPPPGAADKGK